MHQALQKKLEKTPLPEKTTYIESISCAGKLVGNGNGMQYFGAILIESELPVDELKEIYSENSKLGVEVSKQDDQRIQCVEHKELFFEYEFAQDENYYIVYSWGDGVKLFDVLDIRGH